MRGRLVANAALNVLTGMSSAAFAFAVPTLLAHRLDPAGVSIWAIILQTSAYVAPFTFGIQSVLSRYVALAQERGGGAQLDALGTIAVALRMLSFAAIAYLTIGLAAAWGLDRIYPALPPDRLTDARIAFGIYAAGQATLIPAACLVGYFFGVHRNLVVTLNVIGSKLLAGIVIVAGAGVLSLPVSSGLAATVTAIFSIALYRRYRSSVAVISQSTHRSLPRRQIRAQLVRECLPISVWALATFLIYGGSSTVASLVDFAKFPAYAIASGVAMLLLGLHSAAFGPFIPYAAVVAERGGPAAISRALLRASMLSALISVGTVAAFALFGINAVRLLIPQNYQATVFSTLTILLIGNSIRLIGLPYANTLVALGLQGKILWTPVIEAGAAFGSALFLGGHYGVVGVAWSTAIGGVASILMHLVFNMRLTRSAIPGAEASLLVASAPVALAWLIVFSLERNVWNH